MVLCSLTVECGYYVAAEGPLVSGLSIIANFLKNWAQCILNSLMVYKQLLGSRSIYL